MFGALHLPWYRVDVLLSWGHAVNVLLKLQKGGFTLRMPEGREGEGLGEAEGLRVVRMGGRYICGSSIGGSGIDIVLSSICTVAQSSESAFRAENAGGGGQAPEECLVNFQLPGSGNCLHVTVTYDTMYDRLAFLTWPGGAWRGPCGLGAPGRGRGMLRAPRSEQAAPPMREDPGELTIDSSAWLPYRPYGSLREGVVCTCKQGFRITAIGGAAVLLHRCQTLCVVYCMAKPSKPASPVREKPPGASPHPIHARDAAGTQLSMFQTKCTCSAACRPGGRTVLTRGGVGASGRPWLK